MKTKSEKAGKLESERASVMECGAPAPLFEPPLTRSEIALAVELEAPNVPFTMPFFLAVLLEKECRRQGLRKVTYSGPGSLVTVTIKKAK